MQPPAIRVTRYDVTCLPPDHMEARHFTLTVEYRGRGLWAVLDGPFALDAAGARSHEPRPSAREDGWLAAHRFDLDTALTIATRVAPLMTVNGCTVDKILADIAGGAA